MKEEDFVKASNYNKISDAYGILIGVIPGEEFNVDPNTLKTVLSYLSGMRDKILNEQDMIS